MTLISKDDRYPLENQLKRTKNIFVVCTVVFLIVAIANMVTANYDYFVNLLLNVLFTVIYGFYAVYYFTALLPYRKAKCQFFSDWDNGVVNDEFVEIIDQKLLSVTKNRLHYYEINAIVTINGKPTQRQLLLTYNEPLPIGKLFIKSFSNVVIEYKVYHEK